MEPELETKVLPRGNAEDVASPPSRLEPGPGPGPQRIGRYEVVLRLGHGGMATVYLGRATGSAGFERAVAIKVIHPHLVAEPEFVEMFLDEARIAAKIHSPHVASIIDLGEDAGFHYMVLEYIDGETLSALLRQLRARDERLPLSVALQILADACEGLVAVHGLCDPSGRPYGLVHRDISPQNLMINFDGWSKIVDFGLVKATGARNSSHTGSLRGKLAYMAPEQARGRSLSARTDLFALGVILWEMLTGQRLFHGDSDAETLDNVIRCEVPPLSSMRPDAPAGVERVLQRSLAREAAERYASAEEMLADVRALLRDAAASEDPRRNLGALMWRNFSEQAKYRRSALSAPRDERTHLRLVPPLSGPHARASQELGPAEPVVPEPDGVSRHGEKATTEPTSAVRPVRRWLAWVALPLVGAAAAALFFTLGRGPAEVPAEGASSSAPPATPQPRTVVWYLESVPEGATVSIQGASSEVMEALAPQLDGHVTPVRLVVPYDEETRLSLSVSKAGYRVARRSLIPMNNENLSVELQVEAAAVEAPATVIAPSTVPSGVKKRPTKIQERPPQEVKEAPRTDPELKDEPKFDLKPSKAGG